MGVWECGLPLLHATFVKRVAQIAVPLGAPCSSAAGHMEEDEELDKNLVEELPKPPDFYKTTTPQTAPPPIPPGDPYTVVYGGYFANTALKPPQSERSGPEFATALKE